MFPEDEELYLPGHDGLVVPCVQPALVQPLQLLMSLLPRSALWHKFSGINNDNPIINKQRYAN